MTGPGREPKQRLRSARGRSTGSQRWLARQLADPYVHRARAEGWRSRSAFKLLEIDDRHRLLRKNMRVIDLGCAPGGWSQVAAARGARVVGLDLLPVDPVEGVTFVEGDFLDEAVQARVLAELGGPADLVLSDMAASSTGQRAVDRLRAEGLAEAVLAFADRALRPRGALLLKLVKGAEARVLAAARRAFVRARLLRPPATRKESSEVYLHAEDFRGQPPDTDRPDTEA